MTTGNGPFGVPVSPGGLRLPHRPAPLCATPAAASPAAGSHPAPSRTRHLGSGTEEGRLCCGVPAQMRSSVGSIFFPLNSPPLLSPCFSHPDAWCHGWPRLTARPGAGSGLPRRGCRDISGGTQRSTHHVCAWDHHWGGRVVPGGGSLRPQRVPAGSHKAGAQGTGLTPSLLPNKRSLSWRRRAGREWGEGGENSKQNQSKRSGRRGWSWAKLGRSGGGAAGGQMWASPPQPTRFCGAVPGLCSERWGKAPAAPAPLGWVRLPQPGVLGVHGDPSVAPTRSASSPCRWGSDSSFALRQDWVPALLVQPGKKPGHKWDLIEVPIPQLTRSR